MPPLQEGRVAKECKHECQPYRSWTCWAQAELEPQRVAYEERYHNHNLLGPNTSVGLQFVVLQSVQLWQVAICSMAVCAILASW